MILAVDVHYLDKEDAAIAGGVLFTSWTDKEAADYLVRCRHGIEDYVPGAFYRRELPCILPLVEQAIGSHAVETVVVDGYVDLPDGPGLGRHLHEAIGRACVVIGVAKTAYSGAPAIAVTRGRSVSPLFVSSTGDAGEAARHVQSMAGTDRIPDLLREADRTARGL